MKKPRFTGSQIFQALFNSALAFQWLWLAALSGLSRGLIFSVRSTGQAVCSLLADSDPCTRLLHTISAGTNRKSANSMMPGIR